VAIAKMWVDIAKECVDIAKSWVEIARPEKRLEKSLTNSF
jgi:hypothetical protein